MPSASHKPSRRLEITSNSLPQRSRHRATQYQIRSSKTSRLHSFKELLERREIFHSKPKEEKGEPVETTANAGRLSSETVRLLRAELAAISDTRPKVSNIFQDTTLPRQSVHS